MDREPESRISCSATLEQKEFAITPTFSTRPPMLNGKALIYS